MAIPYETRFSNGLGRFLESKLFVKTFPVKFDESPEAPLSRLDDG
ncbi:uncharacterized protein METZ01_LOCUS485356, partial [marine metagenome]